MIPEQIQFLNEECVTTSEAAAMLKVSVGTVYNLCDDGQLRSFQRGGRGGWRMISRKSVTDLVKRWNSELQQE